jgi:uncharacterized spore protein YtfJ
MQAMDRAEDEARAAGFLSSLAERLGGSASARTIYGDPVERDGVTVIPVATARWGFGGGSGTGGGPQGEGSGSGGGGGMIVTPTGYIEISGGQTRFRRIGLPLPLFGSFGLGMAVGWLLGRLRRRY